MDAKTFEELRRQVNLIQREDDRNEGAIEEILKTLYQKYDCSSIEEAEALLKEMKDTEKSSEKKLKKKQSEFEEKWADVLEELDGH